MEVRRGSEMNETFYITRTYREDGDSFRTNRVASEYEYEFLCGMRSYSEKGFPKFIEVSKGNFVRCETIEEYFIE